MVLLENKLSLFYDVVYKKREQEEQEKLTQLERQLEEEREKKENTIQKREKELIARRASLGVARGHEMVAQAIEERRGLQLVKTNKLLMDFVEKMLEKGMLFVTTKEYKEYLLQGLETSFEKLEDTSYRLGTTQRDWNQYQKEIQKLGEKYNLKLRFVPMDEKIIGGFIISDEADTYNLDNTILEKIQSHKYDMGMMLHKIFGKEGEAIE